MQPDQNASMHPIAWKFEIRIVLSFLDYCSRQKSLKKLTNIQKN